MNVHPLLPGLEELRDEEPVNSWSRAARTDDCVGRKSGCIPHRQTTLYSSLSAALDHVESRKYGTSFTTSMTPFMRRDIEVAFDEAMQSSHAALALRSTSFLDVTADAPAADETLPLYRCEKDGVWTMVVKDAKLSISKSEHDPEVRSILVDYLKVEIAQKHAE